MAKTVPARMLSVVLLVQDRSHDQNSNVRDAHAAYLEAVIEVTEGVDESVHLVALYTHDTACRIARQQVSEAAWAEFEAWYQNAEREPLRRISRRIANGRPVDAAIRGGHRSRHRPEHPRGD